MDIYSDVILRTSVGDALFSRQLLFLMQELYAIVEVPANLFHPIDIRYRRKSFLARELPQAIYGARS